MIVFVVSFVLGLAFEKFFALGWSAAVLALLVSAFLFLYFRKEVALVKIILALGLGLSLGILRMSFVDTSPDPVLLESVGQKVSLEASVSEEPDVRDTSIRYVVSLKQISLSGYSQKCLASLTEASTRKNSAEFYPCISEDTPKKKLDSHILLIADRFPELKYGDRIKVSGNLQLPKNFTSENGSEFDYVSYLKKDQIHFLIYHPQIEKMEGTGAKPVTAFLYSLKNIFLEKISAVVPEPNASLLGGLIFGAKQSLGAELLEDFRKAGLIHIVVLSGYNMTVIAAGIFAAVSYFGKRNLSFVVSAVAIVLFSIMVGLGATVVRAAVMALIAILAKFLGRPADALRWLFIAAFLMLLWNPLSLLYDPSFQLSFMATLGLIIFSPFVHSFISNHRIGKFIPEKFGIREIVSATLAVQLFILPLLVRMSGEVSLVAFLVNPLVLPLVPLIMALGSLTGGIGLVPFVGKMLSWPFGTFSYLASQIIISVTELSANIPLAAISIGVLPPLVIVLWYLGCGVLYFKIKPQP